MKRFTVIGLAMLASIAVSVVGVAAETTSVGSGSSGFSVAAVSGGETQFVPFVSGKLSQSTLTVVSPGVKTFGDPPFQLTTSGGSGSGAVSYLLVSGPGTVSSSGWVTITGAGSIVVQATKASDPIYNATTSANLSITVNPPPPKTYYVDVARSDDSGDGLSWATAKKTIPAAIALTVPTDTIVVTNGIYAPISFPDNRAILIRSVNGAAATIIDGGGNRLCALLGSDGSHTNTVLAGFTLRNGNAEYGGGSYGGTLNACILSGNTASQFGGGSCGGTLNSCTLSGNTADSGGGSYDSTLNNCTLSGNTALQGGGSFYATLNSCTLSENTAQYGGGSYYGTLNTCTLSGNTAYSGGGSDSGTLNNCTLSGNTAQSGGGSYDSTLNNCTLSGNTADYGGGSVYGTLNSCTLSGNTADYGGGSYEGTLNNCTLSGNTAVVLGGGSYDGSLTNSIVWGNFADGTTNNYDGTTFSHSCTTPLPAGTGNVDADPLFVDAAATNLRLRVGSPCINAGLNASVSGTTDLDGNPRIVDGVVDMGCYESPVPLVEYYVDAARPDDSGDGLSWATAKKTIPAAIALAVSNDTIVVTNGIYAPISITDNRAILIRSVNGAAATIIDGGGTNRCATLGSTDAHTNTVLTGFTLRNGYMASSNGGGSMYGTLNTCTLSGNSAFYGGGSCRGTLNTCTLSGNTASQHGGGSYDSTLNNCTLSGNTASLFGGGSYYGTLNNCTLSGNTSSVYGGGSSYGTLNNCTLSGNTSPRGGGSYQGTLNNCTLFGNTASVSAGGSRSGSATNCIVWGNFLNGATNNYDGTTFSYSCTWPLPAGTGNVASDPLFVDVAVTNLRLRVGSPCINAGLNASVSGTTDLDGNPRIVGGQVDMGSYESPFTNQVALVITSPGAKTYGDAPFQLATTGGSGTGTVSYLLISGPGTVSSSGLVTITGVGEIVVQATKAGDDSYTSVTSTNLSITVSKASQTALVITSPGTKTYGDAPFQLATTGGSSTGTVSYLLISGPGTVSSSGLVTITGVGEIVVQATKASDANYNSVTSANLSITVNAAGPITYYVDAARPDDSGDGLSWATAKKTIHGAIGLTVSNDTIVVTNGIYAPISITDNRAILIRSVNGADVTIIDGGGSSRCVTLGATGSHTNTVLTGFTLRNGDATGGGYGGGSRYGTLNTCILSGNTADYGGGSYQGTLNTCILSGNTATLYGGGSYYGTLNNCTLSGNTAFSIGGGSYYGSLANCIVWGNFAGGTTNNHESTTFSHSCTTPLPAGTGNVAADPLFVNAAATNLRLRVGSPCINAGLNASVSGTTDLDGNARIVDGVVDMGCYEYAPVPLVEYYVDAARPDDSGNGLSWATAKKTIPAAIALAVSNDTIVVTNGIYAPISITDNRAILIRSVNGADVTIIDGGGSSRCATLGASSTHTNTVLAGFTLRNGYMASGSGGGSYCGTLNTCTLSGNTTTSSGGGSCLSILNNCTLSGNTAASGGGGSFQGTLNNCTLSGNTASAYGGGSYEGTLNNCTLSGNTALVLGGGSMYGTLNNCTLSGNTASDSGGGSAGGTLNNCTLSANTASTSGGGSFSSALRNCIVWGNFVNGVTNNHFSSTVNYSCTWPLPAGTGNVAADPLFVNVAATNLRVRVGSPCINTGTNGFVSGTTDLDGNPRIVGGQVDMGSYESPFTNQVALVITSPGAKTYGDAAFQLATTGGSSTGTVSYLLVSGPATVSPSGWVTITGTGTIVVQATKAGVDDYNSATSEILTITVNAAGPKTYYVDMGRSDDSGDGLSWARAKKTIQAAIALTVPTDTIVVTNGIYAPISITDNRAILIRSVNGAAVTSIDGGGSSRCAKLGNSETHTNTVLTGFTLRNGSSSAGGGSFYGTVNNCMLSGNTATYGGGSAYGTVNNCTLSENTAQYGGGSYLSTLNNCTLSGNTATSTGGGSCEGTLNNCIVWGNFVNGGTNNHFGTTFSHSCTTPLPAGTGNVAADPLFVNVAATNLRVRVGSPCINTGTNGFVSGTTDLDGNLRIIGGRVDMGSYESPYSNQVALVITSPGAKTYGDAPFQLATTGGSSTGTVSYLLISGPGTVSSSGLVTITGVGEIVVQATQADDDNYTSVTSANLSITVNRPSQMVFYVDVARPDDSGDGFSWATAKKNIQAAIGLVVSNDTIVVTNGLYAPISITNNLPILIRSVNGADVTIIDGGGTNRCALLGTMPLSALTNTVLTGFTLRNGYASNSLGGGGVYGGTVNTCMLSGNRALNTTGTGGGSSYSTLNNCTISGNTAAYGGASYQGTLNNCTIFGNTAWSQGGGSYYSKLNNCTLSGNTAQVGGGSSYVTLNNCTLSGNIATNGGGSFYGTLNNCTLSGNRASVDAGGSIGGTLNNCIVWGNFVNGVTNNYSGNTFRYSCTWPLPSGTGNVAADPLFVDVTATNLRVRAGSPCINTGTNEFVSGGTDLDGNPRIIGGRVDMGSYESPFTNQVALVITSPGAKTYGDVAFQLATTGGSGTGALSYLLISGPGTVSSSGLVTITGAGNIAVQAAKAADANYNSVTSTNLSITVSKASQTALVITSPGTKTYGDAAFQLATTGGSSTGTVSYLLVSGPGTVSSSGLVTITGVGEIAVQATKAGDDNYTSVTSANLSITVNKASQTSLVITSPGTKTYGDAAFQLATTGGSSTGTVSYLLISGPGTVSSSGLVTITGVGEIVVQATQAGDDNYTSVTSANLSITVNRPSQMVFYVDAEKLDDSGDGFSWATAKKSIQAAIGLVVSNDTIVVTNGIYAPISITTDLPILIRSVNGAAVTIIDGGASSRCATLGTDGSHTNTVLAGFTLRNGNADGVAVVVERGNGGGSCFGTLNICTLSGNTAQYGGGSSGGTLNTCTLSGNTAQTGGGSSGGTLNTCTFSGNTAQYGGGSSGGTLNTCTLSGNTASDSGGGSSGGTLNSCMLSGNTATNWGGGSYYSILNTSTLSGNTASRDGGGSSRGALNTCIVWGNFVNGATNNYSAGEFSYSCTTPLPSGPENGGGNIAADPLFENVALTNLNLRVGSPCINTGTNGSVFGTTDLDGNLRIIGGRVDMGCYESPYSNQVALVVDDVGTKLSGDAPFQLTTSGGDGTGAVTYLWVSGPGTVSPSGLVTITGVGEIVVKVVKAADANYTETQTQLTITVAGVYVTFEPQGGTIIPVQTGATLFQTVYTNLPTAVREDYIFRGWYATWTNGAVVVSNQMPVVVQANHVLYAKWVAVAREGGAAAATNGLSIVLNPDGKGVSIRSLPGASGVVALPDRMPNTPEGLPVTEVASYAFCNRKGVTDVKVGIFVTNIADFSFAYCSTLTNVLLLRPTDFKTGLPTTLTIGKGAFGLCESLVSVTIPEGTISIGQRAFAQCFKLTAVKFECSVAPAMPADVFTGTPKTGALTVQVPSGATGYSGGVWDTVTVEVLPALRRFLSMTISHFGIENSSSTALRTFSAVPVVERFSLAISVSGQDGVPAAQVMSQMLAESRDKIVVEYRTQLGGTFEQLLPAGITDNGNGSATIRVDIPAGNKQGFFRVVIKD